MKTHAHSTKTSSYVSAASKHTCPLCGEGDLMRIRRRPIDRLFSLFGARHRYRCFNNECLWQGNLRTHGHASTRTVASSH